MADKNKCYYCGKVRCECELPTISWPALRMEVNRRFRNGEKYDRDMLNTEQVKAILRQIDILAGPR